MIFFSIKTFEIEFVPKGPSGYNFAIGSGDGLLLNRLTKIYGSI